MKNIMGTKWMGTVLGLLAVSPLWAGGEAGTVGAEFLRMGAGARGMSMGEGFSALVDDANALYWNPAALAGLEKRSATFMHATTIEDSFYDFGGYGQKVGKSGGLGVGFQYYSAGELDNTDVNGNKTGTSTPNDVAVLAGYGHSLGAYQLGLTGKYVQSQLVDTASTFAFDAGVLTPWYFNDRVRLAATVVNVGGTLTYDKESTDLPMAMGVGAGVKIMKNWVAGADVVAPKDNDTYLGLGTEYKIPVGDTMGLALRAGYNTIERGGDAGVTGGVGFRLQGLDVDYALVTQGDFDASHRISVGYRF
ncbi:MAG: PorV/PorQ family protein [Elusimicrobia bacterium]|nr:PorV/PorQ family protein [Elusimicrobiota bacterium]